MTMKPQMIRANSKFRERLQEVLKWCSMKMIRGPAFIEELLLMIPNAQYYKRGTYDLKKIIEYVNKKEFTSLIVVHTVHREQDALLIISLPNGPTAHFKLSKLIKIMEI
ncbi:ribosome production factor 1-like [Rosa chinensis]|uniref:ribosome production factor 1-like n=1 Tax=Rosa chinensis TaxID=74649 RepID=UPI001AD8C953|nr:ribosome production factor 1-like [Rosa chinensis]XP_040368926.1 ribosome production factor 1-like [Rosa chinensis]